MLGNLPNYGWFQSDFSFLCWVCLLLLQKNGPTNGPLKRSKKINLIGTDRNCTLGKIIGVPWSHETKRHHAAPQTQQPDSIVLLPALESPERVSTLFPFTVFLNYFWVYFYVFIS